MRRSPHNFGNRHSFALLILLASFAISPIAAAKVRQAPITASPTPQVFADNFGVWATVDRLFWAEPDFAESEQGLSGFVQFGWAPGDRNPVDRHYGAGLVYRGWFEGRDADVCGAGVTAVVFSNEMHRVNGATREITTELFYKAYLTDHLSLQFDLQYISLPNGFLPDALAPGVRFEAVF